MVKYITSLDNKIIKYTLKLQNNKYQKEEKKFIIETGHLLEMAKSNLEYVLTLKELDLDPSITQYIVTPEILKKVSINKSFSKVIGVSKFLENDFIKDSDIVYLEDVQDPGNVGTILRTALAFSYFNIGLSNKTASIYNQKTIQASQGSIFDLKIKNFSLLDLKKKKEEGYKILITTLSPTSIYLNDFKRNKNEKLIIVFGNEGQGVSEKLSLLADYKIKIDIKNIDSLNVAIASGIILYSLKI